MKPRRSSKSNGEDKNASKPLSETQKKILKIIKKHIFKYNVAPSFREIGEEADIPFINTVRWHLGVLERRGRIRITKGAARCISIVNDNKRINRNMPVKANIENRKLKMVISENDDIITTKYFQIQKDSFVIHVTDNSLIEDYKIRQEDNLIIHPNHDFQNEDVALLVDENDTIYFAKYLQQNADQSGFQLINNPTPNKEIPNITMLGYLVTLMRFQI